MKVECKFCNILFGNAGAMAAHSLSCKKNPNRKPRSVVGGGVPRGRKSPLRGRSVGRLPVWDEKFPLSEVMVENSTYTRGKLKKRLIADEIIPYECAKCNCPPEWQGKPMVLVLDHINGINNDHRINNLRFLCSNCNSQLPTFAGRNRGRVKGGQKRR